MSDIRNFNEKKEYQKTVSLASRYLVSKNKELLSLYGVAKKEISKERINKITININKTPRDDFSKLLGFYQELSVLDPTNRDYSKKAVFYEQKIADRERSERLLEAKADQKAEQVAFAKAQTDAKAASEAALMERLSLCDSEHAIDAVRETVDSSPLGRVKGLSIIKIKKIYTDREGGGVRNCKGFAYMNAGDYPISYKLYIDEYGDNMIEVHIDGLTK